MKVCAYCGSSNVWQGASVNPNNPADIYLFDDFDCGDCGNETSLITKEEWDAAHR